MMQKLSNKSKYGSTKTHAMSIIGTVLLNKGYEPSFVAGILGNIYYEGSIGKFESSNYVSHPNLKPTYLKLMDQNYDYRNKYSGKCVTDVSMKELKKLMEKLKSNNFEKGKFGLGCIQWTGGRTYNLVQVYLQECNNADRITLDQATAAEGKMVVKELSGFYKYIYNQWNNENSNKKSANAAYNAGSIICRKYEIPANAAQKAVTRGNLSKEIYNIMVN